MNDASPKIILNTIKKAMRFSKSVTMRNNYSNLPKEDTEIFVINRVGELGLWYKMAFVSFIGNSLNLKGIKEGKNPFEALQAKSIVIHCPKMLEPGYDKISSIGISDIVEDRYDISSAVIKYSVAKRREEKIKRGLDFIKRNKSVAHKLIDHISIIYDNREAK